MVMGDHVVPEVPAKVEESELAPLPRVGDESGVNGR